LNLEFKSWIDLCIGTAEQEDKGQSITLNQINLFLADRDYFRDYTVRVALRKLRDPLCVLP